MKIIIQSVIKVREDIQRAALLKYLHGCKTLNDIAFLQWRHRFPNKLTSSEESTKELEEMIRISMDRTYHQFKRSSSKASNKTLLLRQNSALDKKGN